MASIIGLGMDAAAGGVFGILGTAIGRAAGFFERGQAFKQEQARWGHELNLHELNMKSRQQESEIERAIAHEQGSWLGLNASLAADAAIGEGSQWVINTLRLVRPVITILLWLIVAWIFQKTQDPAIVEAAVFAGTAATLWWFGDRAPKPNTTTTFRSQ